MQIDIFNNKYALLNFKQKYSLWLIISLLLFGLICFLTIYLKTYDSFKCSGLYLNKKISITVPSSETKNIIKSDYLKVDNKKYNFSIESVSEMEYDWVTNNSYQNIILTTSKSYIENEVLDITFYKNKQRIITKLFNLLR